MELFSNNSGAQPVSAETGRSAGQKLIQVRRRQSIVTTLQERRLSRTEFGEGCKGKQHENSKVSEKLRVAIQAREVAKLQIGSPKRRQARTEQRAETYATIDERQESGERLASEEETKEGVRLGDTKRGTVTFVHPPGSIRLGPGAATPQEKASDMNTDSSERVNAVYRTGRCNGLRDHRGKCQCPKDPSLPCCVRAAKWIKLMFDNKGTKFDHAKYREQYEVGKRSEEPGRTS